MQVILDFLMLAATGDGVGEATEIGAVFGVVTDSGDLSCCVNLIFMDGFENVKL
jgi:hypothetical protein